MKNSENRKVKVLIVYDSVYGNTEKIANAMGNAIASEAKVVHVANADPSELKKFDMLIVGSPTHGGRPTSPVQEFLNKILISNIEGIKVAAFDTRLTTGFVKIFGYAAGRIAKNLEKKGAILVAPAEGFFVKGTTGPLKDGELERAADWTNAVMSRI
ncbi:flavodoxin family protein [Candidatus Bathyarchaeota archaeon]|nr:flavodoxin family protein [Candidatus Bathyarchaeota archaeon]